MSGDSHHCALAPRFQAAARRRARPKQAIDGQTLVKFGDCPPLCRDCPPVCSAVFCSSLMVFILWTGSLRLVPRAQIEAAYHARRADGVDEGAGVDGLAHRVDARCVVCRHNGHHHAAPLAFVASARLDHRRAMVAQAVDRLADLLGLRRYDGERLVLGRPVHQMHHLHVHELVDDGI